MTLNLGVESSCLRLDVEFTLQKKKKKKAKDVIYHTILVHFVRLTNPPFFIVSCINI